MFAIQRYTGRMNIDFSHELTLIKLLLFPESLRSGYGQLHMCAALPDGKVTSI